MSANAVPAKSTAPRYWAVVPAAGVGKRIQAITANNTPKQYLQIQDRTILEHTLNRLKLISKLSTIVLVLGEKDEWWPEMAKACKDKVLTVTGGKERVNSVHNGLQALVGKADPEDWVLVHDAVRPCVSIDDIEKLFRELENNDSGGLLASPVRETLKQVDNNNQVARTVPREHYWLAATPQMFRFGVLVSAIEKCLTDKTQITDEAHAMEYAGHPVKIVHGSADNIKITHAEDVFLAEQILNKQAAQ